MTEAVVACLGLGANLGDRAATLAAALAALGREPGIRLLAAAEPIETEPLGPPQPRYLNTACILETNLTARELLSRCLQIEADLGRVRTAGERWGPRPIDMDLLLFGAEVIAEEGLTVPHPELHRRRFVLEPLATIAPGVRHPLLKASVAELLARLEGAG